MERDPLIPARRSIRLQGYDYSQAGTYFVTICARNRRRLFGEITNGAVRLNETGTIVRECWLEIPRHFPGVELHAHVIVPNHVHGILAIHRRARHAVPLREPERKTSAFAKPMSGSLALIIGSFKSAVTRRVRAMRGAHPEQFWQRNYYERIIRSGDEFAQISRYIGENPQTWEFDEENPDRRNELAQRP